VRPSSVGPFRRMIPRPPALEPIVPSPSHLSRCPRVSYLLTGECVVSTVAFVRRSEAVPRPRPASEDGKSSARVGLVRGPEIIEILKARRPRARSLGPLPGPALITAEAVASTRGVEGGRPPRIASAQGHWEIAHNNKTGQLAPIYAVGVEDRPGQGARGACKDRRASSG